MIKRTVDLKKTAGISMTLGPDGLNSNDFVYRRVKTFTIDNMQSQLLNQDLYCPEIFYYKYLQFDHNKVLRKKKLRLNFYVVDGGVAGIEFLKTHAYRLSNYPKILEIAYGAGMVVFLLDDDETTLISRVKAGNKIVIPAGASVVFINTRYPPLVVAEIYTIKGRNRKTHSDTRGLPYYIISKNSKPAIVKNPRFRNIKDFTKFKWDSNISDYNISPKTPIVKQILRKYEKFDWLFKENSITTV
ncbi:hypothetical protein GF357_01655 [Candidatus Dojkabacteria bacterium]|nr:hypothetical protein [Candidatus Dojkabacteria bacterium]